MKTLLHLQELDLRIEACKAREREIPKQKGKYEIQRERLAAELDERERQCRDLQIEQHECETDIDQMQTHIQRYEQQLLAIKKNEEYQALLHEIDGLKKQIGLKEERVITLMLARDEARARLEADQKRIKEELDEIDRECEQIDDELAEAAVTRGQLEQERVPVLEGVDTGLRGRYQRIRASKGTGAAVVAIRGEICSGCNMSVPAQIINEILAGEVRACNHCGRLLYDDETINKANADASAG